MNTLVKQDLPILVVEDDIDTAKILCSILDSEGYKTEFVDSGLEGMQKICETEKYCAAFLDLMMPGVSGYDVLKVARSNSNFSMLPIIVVTARDLTEDKVQALEMGANDFVVKPFVVSELMARLRNALRERDIYLELSRKNRELDALAKIKDHFMSMAAHDLRAPLTNIMGFAELLRDGLVRNNMAEQDKAIKIIINNCHHIMEMLHKFMDVNLIDRGELGLNFTPCQLGAVLKTAYDSFLPQARQKDIFLDLTETWQEAPQLVCDHERIICVLENLLSNAVKFCHPGDAVQVGWEQAGDSVIVFVRDTGPGISREEIGHVFKRFPRISVRPTGGEKSVGLGLSLAKEIVEMHEGHAYVRSEQGKGSEFGFSLPLKSSGKRRHENAGDTAARAGILPEIAEKLLQQKK